MSSNQSPAMPGSRVPRPRRVDITDHRRRLAAVTALAEALPATAVRRPDMPVSRFVEEGFCMLIAVREHYGALARVGVSEDQVERFKRLLFGIQSAQAVWEHEINTQETAERAGAIERASRLRNRLFTLADDGAADLRACAAFAFRNDRTDERLRRFVSIYRCRHGWGYRTRRGLGGEREPSIR